MAPANVSRGTSSGGNLLTKKVGPLPGWGWLVVALVGYYLYKKVSGGTTTPTSSAATITPATVTETLPGGGSYTGPASSAPPFPTVSAGSGTAAAPGQGSAGTSPGSGGGSPGALPAVNWQNYPSAVSFAQLQGEPGAYQPLAYYSGAGGQGYTGAQVSGGVPVYAAGFGGLVQGFNPASLPAGTQLFIPSQFSGYVQGTPASGPQAPAYAKIGQ